MSRFTTGSLVVAGLLAGTFAVAGCNRSADSQDQKIVEAQQKASEKTAEAMNKANEKASEAVAEGSQKAAEAYDKANRTAEREAAKASEKTAKATEKIDEKKEDLRQKFEAEVGKIDKRIIDVRTKLSNAATTKVPREELAKTLSTAQDRSNQVREKINELQSVPPAKVEMTKKAIETELAEVKQTLDSIESQT